MAGASDRWQDLRPRLISAAVMIAVGVVEIVLGGWPFLVLVGALISLMIWELAAMTGRPQGGRMAVGIALLAALVIGMLVLAAASMPRQTR